MSNSLKNTMIGPWRRRTVNRRGLSPWPLRAVGAAALLAAALSGCATSSDPAEGGFINGVVGIAGGGYDRRVAEREDAYRKEVDTQTALQAEARRLERERAEVRGQLTQAEGRLAAQQRRIAAERRRLGAARGAAARAEMKRLDEAQAQVDVTSAAVRAASRADQPLPDLKASAQSIEAELARIDELVGVVGGGAF